MTTMAPLPLLTSHGEAVLPGRAEFPISVCALHGHLAFGQYLRSVTGNVIQGRPYAGVLVGQGRPPKAPEPWLGQQTCILTAVEARKLGSRGPDPWAAGGHGGGASCLSLAPWFTGCHLPSGFLPSKCPLCRTHSALGWPHLNDTRSDLSPTEGHILRCWGSGLQHMNFGGTWFNR